MALSTKDIKISSDAEFGFGTRAIREMSRVAFLIDKHNRDEKNDPPMNYFAAPAAEFVELVGAEGVKKLSNSISKINVLLGPMCDVGYSP